MSLVFLNYLNPDLRNISLIFIIKGSLFLSLFDLESTYKKCLGEE